MTLSNNDQARIRDYLLGKLTEEEQEKIEERLMVENDFFQELEISKAECIEEYRAGELNQKEREWFERFLTTPEGRRSHAFAVAVECLERNHQPRPLSLHERFVLLFRNPQWATATVALAALVIIVSIIWIRPQRPSKFVAIRLTNSTIQRAAGEIQRPDVKTSRDITELRATLMLPRPGTPDARYQVELDNRRTTTTYEPTEHDTNSVLVVIPIDDIPSGFYALRIYEIKKDGTKQQIPGDYFFSRP